MDKLRQRAAPHVIQVADRWHPIENASRAFARCGPDVDASDPDRNPDATICLPMIPPTLARARIGAIYSVVLAGFSPDSPATQALAAKRRTGRTSAAQ